MLINGVPYFKKSFTKTLPNHLLIQVIGQLRNNQKINIGKYEYTSSDVTMVEEIMKNRKVTYDFYAF